MNRMQGQVFDLRRLMPPRTRGAAREAGLSLVELMVSVAIGLVVVGAVLYVYLSARGAYSSSKSTSRTQEAGRFGLDAILRDVRQAGFIGCGSRLSVALSVPGSPVPVPISQTATPAMNLTSVAQAVMGYSASSYAPGSGAPWTVPTAAAPNPPNPPWYAGDVFTLHVGTASPVQMAANPNSGASANALFLNNNCAGIAMDNYVMVSTCSAATIVRVSNSPTGPAAACPASGVVGGSGVEVDYAASDANGTAVNSLTGGVTPSTIANNFPVTALPTVQPFDEVTYYVGQVAGNVRAPALYRYSLAAQEADEIIDHVENMSVYYGVPANCAPGGQISYLSAQQVQAANQWSCVTNIRVQLLTAGDELGAVPSPQVIQIGAPGGPQSITAPDTRYRQLFTATAALRDRLQ